MPTIKKHTARPPSSSSEQGSDSAWDLVDAVHMLLYGRSATGKTTLWATFPGPILALICSGGTKPGELRSIDTPEYRRKIAAKIVRSTDQLSSLLEDAKGWGADKTVVLDHASGLQDLTLKEILGLDELPAQRSWGMASREQYGQCSLMCKEMFRSMLNLSCNVVIVAQERTFGEEGGSDLIAPTVGAALTPSTVGWLNPACDYVVQTFIRNRMVTKEKLVGQGKDAKKVKTQVRSTGVEYCLRTEPHDVYITKFRVPRGRTLPAVIVDPTFSKIQALIQGEKG